MTRAIPTEVTLKHIIDKTYPVKKNELILMIGLHDSKDIKQKLWAMKGYSYPTPCIAPV